MSFGLDVVGGAVEIEPGSTATVAIEITNRADLPERFELILEGIDPTWTAIPVPEFVVEPHATHSERIFLKPPRESDSTAGTYPYVVAVRSLDSGEVRRAQGVLELKPYHHFTIDIQPKRASVGAFNKEADLDVTIINLGNSEHRIQLFASDQDDQFAFEIEEPQIQLGPGQQKTVPVTATTARSSFLANPRLDPITVSGRSLDKPNVSASAQGQIERRPLLTPASVFFFIAIIAAFVVWLLNMPKAPEMASFAAMPQEGIVGEELSLTWQARNADSVTLEVLGEEALTGLNSSGSYKYVPRKPGTLAINAYAVSNGKRAPRPKRLVLTVREPERAPAPQILSFEASSTRIRLGDVVTFRFKLGPSVTRANLEPIGSIDPRSESQQVQPLKTGRFPYTLTAVNADEQTVKKTITISVTDESTAEIASLEVSPSQIEEGSLDPVTIRWRINGAVQATLAIGSEPAEPIDPRQGELQIAAPTSETTIKIEAFDERGRAASKSAKIRIKKPEPPEPPADPESGGGAAGPATAGDPGDGRSIPPR
jgi:hypothetical protein